MFWMTLCLHWWIAYITKGNFITIVLYLFPFFSIFFIFFIFSSLCFIHVIFMFVIVLSFSCIPSMSYKSSIHLQNYQLLNLEHSIYKIYPLHINMIIFLNVFSKNSYNNQKQKQTKRKTTLKKTTTIDNNKHYPLPFNNPILQIHNSNK